MTPSRGGDQADLQHRAAARVAGERVPAQVPDIKFWTGAAVTISVFGGSVLLIAPLGPLARHMSGHILLMNVIAPLLAIALAAWFRDIAESSRLKRSLLAASTAQIIVLWSVHAPAAMESAAQEIVVSLIVQASLLGVALWFWLSVLVQSGAARYRALFALLVTGKLFCLLAALMVFAPRLLYSAHVLAHAAHGAANFDPLSDQQLAGLLMLVVCPLTYVAAGIVIAEKWLRELAEDTERDAVIRAKPISAR